MKKLCVIAACLIVAGCGKPASSESENIASIPATEEKTNAATVATASPTSKATETASASPSIQRAEELSNPTDAAMVFLYYTLANIPPPTDQWVEDDTRVRIAHGPDKASVRQQVRAELEAGIASVQHVGLLRFSLANAQLSDYDPTYGEFTIGALSPSSMLTWRALNQNVQLNFANARTAQTWKVSTEEAQIIRDKVGRYGRASLDVLVKVTGVIPGPNGGKITTEVVEYELRHAESGTLIGRVKPI